jgi:hypothetical protein
MEAAGSTKSLVQMCQTLWCNTAEDSNLYTLLYYNKSKGMQIVGI